MGTYRRIGLANLFVTQLYLYGMQPATFVQYAKIGYGVDMSLEEATRIRNSFFEANYELHKYYKDTQDALLSKGYVTSIMGRRYKVGFKHLAFPDNRQLYMRKILNFPVQSAASDWALCALYEIYKTFSQDEVKICATVHDSIIMEIRKNENFAENIKKIQAIMQSPQLAKKYITKEVDLPIVADIEVGPWGIGVSLEEYMEGTHE